mmetsp:Transcript_18957/g.43204  ORF Transcript_18957/g.43204 Transcript_18957/m.43204 type:complete len:225 (-) Transcript_18957:340-1014(-)
MGKKRKSREYDADGEATKISLVKYDQILDKPAEDKRYERERTATQQPPSAMGTGAPSPPAVGNGSQDLPASAMSSSMDAVMRLMTGREDRTLAQKLADSNRPTWEQYKKDNEDKLNLEGADAKKMAEYREELDKERDKLLSKGRGRRRDWSGDDDSDDDDSKTKKRRKKDGKKKKKEKSRDRGRDRERDRDRDRDLDRNRRHRRDRSHRDRKSHKKIFSRWRQE